MLRAVATRLVLLAMMGLATATCAQTQQAVEYIHAGWGHYFVTASPDEIAALDGGAFGGAWSRTGQAFGVWTAPDTNNAQVCRFFSTSFSPRSSHFYTLAGECDTLKENKDWQFETIAFHLRTTDAGGNCAAGTAPLFRLYNNSSSGAPNHRYTKSRGIVDQMRGQGWSSEGSGPDVTFACLPAETTGGGASAAGVWTGSTSGGEAVTAIILEDGTYYIPFSSAAGLTPTAMFQGSATTSGGAFASTNGMHFLLGIVSSDNVPASLSGTYVPGGTLQLAVSDHRGSRTLTASFVPGSNMPVSLAAAVGDYIGETGHAAGSGMRQATFTVEAGGAVVTRNNICATYGTAVPRPGVAAFDWTAVGIDCPFGSETLRGVVYYDAATRRISGFATFDGREDLFFFRGGKL